jgi:hypothetical protein
VSRGHSRVMEAVNGRVKSKHEHALLPPSLNPRTWAFDAVDGWKDLQFARPAQLVPTITTKLRRKQACSQPGNAWRSGERL